MDRLQEAIEACETALELEPGFSMAVRNLDKAKARLIAPDRGFGWRRSSGVGVAPALRHLADDGISAMEERAIWARYGL